DALLQPVVVPVEKVPAHVRARRRPHDLLRILLRDVGPEHLPERHGHPPRDANGKPVAHRLPQPGLLSGAHGLLGRHPRAPSVARRGRSIGSRSVAVNAAATPTAAHRRNGPLPYRSGSTITMPVNTIHTRPVGSSTFHPKFISRS